MSARSSAHRTSFTTGTLTLREATDWSVNAVFARLIMEVGPEKVVDAARRMGITSPLEPNPAIALGGLSKGVSPLEMASAYGTLASGGMHAEPTAILRVTDDRGKVLFAGDMFIWASPNCGNPQKVQRYAEEWAAALRTMAALDAELLLPGHGLA